jgi:hypothetical protein
VGANTHTHSHTHTGPSHVHTGPSHAHVQDAHEHTTNIDHSHGPIQSEPASTGGGNDDESAPVAGTGQTISLQPHEHDVIIPSFDVDPRTSSSVAAVNQASGTGDTGASGTGNTGSNSSGASDGQPASYANTTLIHI